MQTSKNPAKSRPLSANVKRLMRLARASPENEKVQKSGRQFSVKDLACCSKQGSLFMEAASMGFSMEDFAPLYMTSQVAGIFDVYFSTSNGVDNNDLFGLMQVPMLLKSPETVVEALYWIDDIIERAQEGENKSLLVSRAYDAEKLRLPPALEALPEEPNRNVDDLAYAYWLGYIYRCECLMHEESSRMVYGAITEAIMREAYKKMLELSRNIQLPDSEDKRCIIPEMSGILPKFFADEQEQITQILQYNKRLPQEILSYPVLADNMR